jgi:hypothetical protein
LKAELCLVAVLFMFFSLIAIASVLVTSVAATDPVIVGKWDRTDGADKYTIYTNGITETVLSDGTHHGTWKYDGSSGYKFIFHWDFGPSGKAPFVDYVTVAADGQSYSGYNNYGDHFNCVRISYETGIVPVADSGFPIFYVAVGGGIAAIAVVGAAVYFFFIARGSAGASAGALAGGTLGTSVEYGVGSIFETSLLGAEADPVENVLCNMLSETISSISNDLGYSSDSLRAGVAKPIVNSVVNSSSSTLPLKRQSESFRTELGRDGVARDPSQLEEIRGASTPTENTGTSESSESGTSSDSGGSTGTSSESGGSGTSSE